MMNRSIFSIFSLTLVALCGCSSSIYRVHHYEIERIGLFVTADRIKMTCEDVEDPDKKPTKFGRYGFMINILDSEDTVTTVVQTMIISKNDCLSRLTTFETMKKKSNRFYIASFGDMNETRVLNLSKSHVFPNQKTPYPENGRVWSFSILKSESGECFTAVRGKGNPCPKVDEFPIENQPF